MTDDHRDTTTTTATDVDEEPRQVWLTVEGDPDPDLMRYIQEDVAETLGDGWQVVVTGENITTMTAHEARQVLGELMSVSGIPLEAAEALDDHLGLDDERLQHAPTESDTADATESADGGEH